MGPIQTLEELFGMLRRRGWVIALVSVIGMALSLFFALQQPRVYESIAVIQIEQSAVSDSGGSLEQTAARRLQLIEQRLMVRDNLLEMIDEYGLFADAPGLTATQKVGMLRAATSIESIAAPGATGGASVSALRISVRMGTPELAAALANDLATSVTELGARGQGERIEATLQFFTAEERRLTAEIEALESEIADFKVANQALLPESLIVRRNELGRLEESALALERELVALERESAELGENPARALEQRRLSQVEAEAAELRTQRDILAGRIAVLDASIQQTPEAERALNTYERRLQQLQDQASVITQRRAEAEISQHLVADQLGERFTILERAVPADFAEGTSRRKFAMAGVVGSVAAGLFLALLLETLKPVIRSAGQMQRQLDLRPVVTIPYVMTPGERRRQMIMRALGLLIVLLAVLLMLVMSLAQSA